MNTDTFQALQDWLRGRNYTIKEGDGQLVLSRDQQVMAVVTPPGHYAVKAVAMSFNEWVEFNKCLRNIRHYLVSQGLAK